MSNFDRTDPTPARQGAGGSGHPDATLVADTGSRERVAQPSTSGGGRNADGGDRGAPRPAKPIGAIVAALLVGLILGAAGVTLFNGSSEGDDFAGVVDSGRYQAVILSNDKVYFGKISSVSEQFYRLESAFFLREVRTTEEAEPERALLPVNREIHAPDNTMLIRKDEVVLVENLAKDSPILSEINRQKG